MAQYELKVPIDASQKEFASMIVKDLDDRNLFTMVSKAMQSDELSGAEILLNGIWVSGDPVSKISESLYALRAATKLLLPILTVEGGELKKK